MLHQEVGLERLPGESGLGRAAQAQPALQGLQGVLRTRGVVAANPTVGGLTTPLLGITTGTTGTVILRTGRTTMRRTTLSPRAGLVSCGLLQPYTQLGYAPCWMRRTCTQLVSEYSFPCGKACLSRVSFIDLYEVRKESVRYVHVRVSAPKE